MLKLEVNVKKRVGNFYLNSYLFDDKNNVIGIFGKNGSGKTTFLRIISGFIDPDEGFIRLDDVDITKYPPWKRSIALVTPNSYLPNLKVRKHLLITSKKKTSEKIFSEIEWLLDGIDKEKKVKELSLGQRERVALVTALLSYPKLILVDEAFSNIHNKKDFITNYTELIKKLNLKLIFVSQDLSDSNFADISYKMENGELKRFE
ncbi:MAG: ATP-binding cassette domain-containing protein [Sulfolobaceae archaeon]|jgi:molybdate/tungstate transport system ATP-binding protein|nr:ATP-binding cassette domain-containing protein [Sulfolobaceae archaeon]